MEKQKIQQRIEKLRKLIDYHRTLYHTFDAPEVSDAAFDTLKNELEELERAYPEFIVASSPTQKIGGVPLDKFVKIRHEVPMLSFFDAFSQREMEEWYGRLEKHVGVSRLKKARHPLFYCELKIDGLAVELVYENGVFIKGSTRGDGMIGEDVTQNLKTIASIPSVLTQLGHWSIPKHLVVRGEVFISKKELERINKEQEKKGARPFANTRNLAAGSIRQLDPAIAASRKLESLQYALATDCGQKTHEEEHKMLASWGFSLSPDARAMDSLVDVFAFRDGWEKKRETIPYEVDGVVAIINDVEIFRAGGVVGKGPRGVIAYKFSPREATTIVEDVKIQVGRTGILTPVAVLKPVEISGVTITHATLHNFDEIERLDVRIGDTVVVTRSGDVIPKIMNVLRELRTGKEKKISIPKTCPSDGSPLSREGALVRCTNALCGAQNKHRILHFVSRGAFNIQGLGEKIVDRFLDEGLLTDVADIFSLQEGDIASLERFGEKSARNLVDQISLAKKISIAKFLYALGILHVGQETAHALANFFISQSKRVDVLGVLNFFGACSVDQLQAIVDIGPAVSKSIVKWFSDKRNKNLLNALHRAGIILEKPKRKSNTLKGMKIVLTGTLHDLSRQQARELIEEEGGDVQSDVSSHTDVVVVGQNPGSKYQRALTLGIPVWDEEEFLKKIKK